MWANPSWTNVPRHTTNFRSENVHLTHPCFELCRNRLHLAYIANPEPMWQRYTTKPQTPRFSSHTSLFWTLPEQLSIFHHACVPTHPEPTSQDTLQTSIRKFSSHTSLFWTLPEQPETDDTTHVCQPWTYTTKPQTLRCSSHTSVLNFAGTALHVTPRMSANPSWTNVPRHTTNFRSENVHLTHPCFELCRKRLHLACVPTLNQCGKDTSQNLRPQDFHLTHPCFELCRNNPKQTTPRMCANPEPTPQNLRP